MTRLLFRGSHQVALHWICGVFGDQVLKVFENRCRGFGLFWFLQWLEDVCLLESWDNDRVVFSLRTQPLSSFTLVPTARKHTLGALPANGRFTRALKVITWRQPACCPSLIPLSSPPCCLSWVFEKWVHDRLSCGRRLAAEIPPDWMLSRLWYVKKTQSCRGCTLRFEV